MNISRPFLLCLGCACLLANLPGNAEIYRWVDAEGRVIYGDNPPNKKRAQAMQLPILTVADSPASTKAVDSAQPAPTPDPAEPPAAYTAFKISAPAADEGIRANDGNVNVTLDIQPALRAGDSITLYLDGKQVATGTANTFTLEAVERGEHSLFAVLSDAQGNIVQNTETIKFSVLRHSVLTPQP